MFRAVVVTISLIAAVPAAAQAPAAPKPYDRAIAAGYKALTLCSAIFIAGRKQADIESLELTGIYPEYDRIVPTLPATVHRENLSVEVPFDPTLPPRAAALGPDGRGCSVQPIGANIVYEMGIDDIEGGRKVGPGPASRLPWPLGDAGIAPESSPVLVQTVAAAFTAAGPRTIGVLVVRNGKVVAERYADGVGTFTATRTWSVAKSLAGTLVGVAVHQGAIKASDPAKIPAWSPALDPRGTITLDHLLRMASGLHSATAGNRTDAIYFGGTKVSEETVAWPLEVKPGTRFRYANNDILLAVLALRESLAWDRYRFYPREALFARIGMTHTIAETDWDWNYILSSQVWSTARDLARFGQLYLQDGVWNGQRILPEGWVKYVTTPSGPQPEGEFGYGAAFWLMNKSAGVPADTFAAFGNRGQYVVIVPSRQVVIVRRGEDPQGSRFDIANFTADVLAALR